MPAAKPTSRFQIVREHFENAVLDENFVSEHEKSKIVADDKEILVQPERNTSPVTVPFFKSKMLPMGKQEPTQKTLKVGHRFYCCIFFIEKPISRGIMTI